ncbi:hypothetical protein [Mycobacteroides abscessus]|uniref:hypothetical protein n=1 Tax=Mycobacteroides abscessus TaxID=36809 RepID=UPI0019D1C6C5|nr:hypothetical protein [Mycobacteroides abscessus]MBN7483684.1 hypothetical protein [Mycobacteroides abscessus subsp. massiliense]
MTATPTTTLSLAPCPPVNDPTWEACFNSHREQRERDAADRQKRAATTKPAASSGGIPWWVWVLGTLGVIGGLLWWGTTLDDGSSSRSALRTADDDDDDWDDDDDDEPLLTYPAITPVPEPLPYPETPSAPAAPAPSGSLMDRLGGK